MDASLYDEFGNYIGPDLADDSGSSEEEEEEHDEWAIDESPVPAKDGSDRQDGADAGPQDADAAVTEPQQVVLYHDKNYFADASDVFPGAETMVQDEDTQPLETPIIAPVKEKCYELVETEVPETAFDFRFLTALMDTPALVRNLAFVGHLHHGKTTLLDMLVRQTHPLLPEATERYADTRLDERERGIGIKAVPMSLVLQSLRGKSYLVNVLDVPGHPNFADERSASLRMADGVVLVVDAVEGVMLGAEQAIRGAVRQRLPILLVVNKVDRLLLELKLPPTDAYHKLAHTIAQVNACIGRLGSDQRLSPTAGNVVFASAAYSWCFSLASFAEMYVARSGASFSARRFAEKLWGDVYLDPATGRFSGVSGGRKRVFVEFVLEPLYKVYSHALASDPRQLQDLVAELGLRIRRKALQADVKPLLSSILGSFFGSSVAALVDAVVEHVPSPVDGADAMLRQTYSGELRSTVGDAMQQCLADGPLMISVTKLIPRPDGASFDALGRVFSGVLREGDKVRVLREGFSADDDEDSGVAEVTGLAVGEARYRVGINRVPAGNWALISGVDACIAKTATLTSVDADDVAVFRPLRFDTLACVRVAIEPIRPSELPKMLDGLRSISKSYPLAQTRVEDSGEHVVLGSGELYLDCVLHDLRKMYSDIEIKVSDPCAVFSETVLDTSSIKCTAETPNKHSKLTMIAEPLEPGLAADLEAGHVRLDAPKREVAKFFTDKYDWDVLAARSVWAFGPEAAEGANVLLDDTLDDDKTLLYSVKNSIVQGFQWATREGPLCDEPIRNCKFRILDAAIADAPIHRGAGQIIPTARRVVYSSFLLASPRLMEPVYAVQIQTPADCIAAIYKVLARRRGHVTKEVPTPGTPLFDVQAFVPVLDSFGFETDLRTHTQGQVFCLSLFDHWAIVPGDPLDKSVVLHPLEPSPPPALARELMVKTRRRKGLSEDVSIDKFFDDPMLLELAKQDAELQAMQER